MPVCSQINRKRRKVCIGDLDSLITLENRNIQAPEFDEIDYDEVFVPSATVWALLETVRGKTFFDGANTEVDVTHWVYINYDSTVTAETWIKLEDSRRLDILRVENLDERSEFMLLHCVDRGAVEASKS